eukprot:5189502-Prymnesium_polylepis.1
MEGEIAIGPALVVEPRSSGEGKGVARGSFFRGDSATWPASDTTAGPDRDGEVECGESHRSAPHNFIHHAAGKLTLTRVASDRLHGEIGRLSRPMTQKVRRRHATRCTANYILEDKRRGLNHGHEAAQLIKVCTRAGSSRRAKAGRSVRRVRSRTIQARAIQPVAPPVGIAKLPPHSRAELRQRIVASVLQGKGNVTLIRRERCDQSQVRLAAAAVLPPRQVPSTRLLSKGIAQPTKVHQRANLQNVRP